MIKKLLKHFGLSFMVGYIFFNLWFAFEDERPNVLNGLFALGFLMFWFFEILDYVKKLIQ